MEISTSDALARALDYGSLKMQALSNNLSNFNTPGYKRRDVPFADLLNTAVSDDDPHGDNLEKPAITISNPGGAMRLDGNNVDIDTETASMAATEIFYNGAAQLMQNKFTALKYVISGGGQ